MVICVALIAAYFCLLLVLNLLTALLEVFHILLSPSVERVHKKLLKLEKKQREKLQFKRLAKKRKQSLKQSENA